MAEVWKDVEGYEGLYQVSDLGRVKSLDRWRYNAILKGERQLIRGTVRKAHPDRRGYLKVTLYKDGKRTTFPVHRLVAEAFIPNPENKPQINHKDGCKVNNSVDNLEFCTRAENMAHAFGTGLNSPERHWNCNGSKPVAQYDKNMTLLKVYPSIGEAARAGFSVSLIIHCCKGQRKTHRGYIWKYA